MTARIDLAELEQRARSTLAIADGGVMDGRVRMPATDVLALIAAVREARRYRKGQWASKKAARLDAALAAFDFKEETK